MTGAPVAPGRRARSASRGSLAAAVLASVVALAVAGCWGAGLAPPSAPPLPSPAASLSAATEQARIQLEGTLRSGGIALTDASDAYRPAEAPALAAAPRAVFQAVLDGAPDQGRIVVYELNDPQAAYVAAREMAAYLGTGPGRIQFPPDARFALRLLGSTVIFSTWSPAGAKDPVAGDRLLLLLQALGADVPIPSS
jgi:hypothetical protein